MSRGWLQGCPLEGGIWPGGFMGVPLRCSKFPPCVPIFDGGSLVTVWGGVRREPASESLWDEPNQNKNSSKLAKMAQNGQNPALWPLLNVGWHWAVNSISLCIKWYNPLHRHWIEVKKRIWGGGGLRGAPQGVTFGQMGLGVTMHQKSWKKIKIFFFSSGQNLSRVVHWYGGSETQGTGGTAGRVGVGNVLSKDKKWPKNGEILFLSHLSPANRRFCCVKTCITQSLYQGWTQFYVLGSASSAIGAHCLLKPDKNRKKWLKMAKIHCCDLFQK